jgi:SAM-dependent methyltransferase
MVIPFNILTMETSSFEKRSQSSEEINFYRNLLKTHGISPQSLGWKNSLAQITRFEQLTKIIKEKEGFSVNDLGCGFGDLLDFLSKKFDNFFYYGYDTLEDMIRHAIEKAAKHPNAYFFKVKGAEELKTADYSIACGIFNLKFHEEEERWIDYILNSMNFMNKFSTKGFAINFLTSYSDQQYRQDYLFYADPLFFFDYCKKHYSKNVALLHDYNEYDFTILVRK